MFTADETPLLTGSDDEVTEFVDCDRCTVVDWHGTEEETIDDAIRWLPPGLLTYQVDYVKDGSVTVELQFQDRKDRMIFPQQPQNNFRALLRVGRLIQPEYIIKIFRCTEDSDTHGFLLRPAAWWSVFCSQYPKRDKAIFSELEALTEMWGLDGGRQ
jgi:hypothetical protein